ncbi:alkylation response protein AidB-like acyl-CoA dehydrogenase [Arthrobacter ginsengisoli]|uniref:Alkylation response protein AidB-like acyl-CoA dehydrogenase n=1 Tax=Arthrobacter ginsengisoli TaxID=1356565 RepID=A0ABU1UI22_9MICC|nr:acyl-CoA dehydrogenase family protein [Arthrobacter ginsengisoli]MDR7084823.1 alkylation response protein AidB-like acyl-CoA dehydrogenase [Arthrobacter ginsengisoli]
MYLTPELDELHGSVATLMRELVAPRAAEIDSTGDYPTDLYEKFVEAGLLALSLPESLGGPGLGVRGLTIATEEAAKHSAAAGLMLLLSRLPVAPMLVGGTDDQLRRWAVPLSLGLSRGSYAMSEPQAGSDVLGITTHAEYDGSGWRLTGTKAWISGAAEADWFVVVATTAPGERRADAICAFIVDADANGLTKARMHERPGCRGLSLGDIVLDGVAVGEDRRLPGITGVGSILGALATMRPVVSARGLGLASAALMLAVERIEGRQVGGRPVASQQGVQWQVAEAAMELESARLLTYRAAELIDSGTGGPQVAGQLAVAKLASSEIAVKAAGLAAQLHGAEGCVAGHPSDRLVRDSRQLTIVEGTSEIQRNIIARAVFDRSLWWQTSESARESEPIS